MALPDTARREVDEKLRAFCERRVPPEVRDRVRLTYEIRGHSVTLVEERPYFRNPKKWTTSPVAQFRFDASSRTWELHWRDRNSKWHPYDEIASSPDFDDLLDEVDADPTGIFWG